MRVVGINFEHFHMGDLLRMVFNHPDAEIVGICDEQPERMQPAIRNFSVPPEHVFTDFRACLESTKPDLAILCPATAGHAAWVENVAPYEVNILLEKPMAGSLTEADRIIQAVAQTGKTLAINWPMVWSPVHRTAKRLMDEGMIGEPQQVHYYGGNRGPLYHSADKVEISAEEVAARKPASWFYQRAQGGGSLRDYLGYGTTLGTWFLRGKTPIEITTVMDDPVGLEVDEHSITIARYDCGLSKFETRWGTFTDPWTHQPQPKCGFVATGTEGTMSSYDLEPTVRVQTRGNPAGELIAIDTLAAPHRNPVEHIIHCLQSGEALIGPLTPELSRIGQQIVDSAILSAQEKRTVPLVA
jgi:predicted dehydrogenase